MVDFDIDDNFKGLTWRPYKGDYPQITESTLVQIEKDTGFILPEDYRKLVIRYGGYRVDPNGINVMRSRGMSETIFDPMLFISKDPKFQTHYNNLYYYLQEIREGELSYWMDRNERRFSLIPFALSSSTGYFCFDYSLNETSPPVVWMNMSAWPADDGFELSMPIVASSFTDLLSKLHD